MNNFELKIKNYINKNNLISSNKIILAFSYGIDSRALLNVLHNLGYEIIIAHVNHKVRKESDNEEIETIKLCQSLCLKYYIKHLNPKKENFEDYARRERYNFFREISLKENTSILVTAHHKDDNLETILLRMMTGSNLYGYSGIHNIVNRNNLTIVRPMLCVSKDEIKDYQKECGFIYFEDYTNHQNIQLRNKIRNEVIPLLKEISPSILDKAEDYSDISSEAFDFIRKSSSSYYLKWDKKINVNEYITLDKALRHDFLCYFFEQNKINRNSNLILDIDKALLNNKAEFEIKLNGELYLLKRYDVAYISTISYQKIENITLMPTEKKKIGSYCFSFSKVKPSDNVNYINLCYNNIEFPIEIRTRQNGDRIQLSGGSKKIKDLFIDKKIDKSIRDTIPLVLINKEIVWVPNVAKSSLIRDYKDTGDIYLICEV